MATTITCETCSDTRQAAYKNTKYCVKCALLRDMTFVGSRSYECDNCDRPFAPVARRDPFCGHCAFGSGEYLPCVYCQLAHKEADGGEGDYDDAMGYHELHRREVPICVRCLRDPKLRRRVLGSLRKGQAQRRGANNHKEA